jgi:hypothetical protein
MITLFILRTSRPIQLDAPLSYRIFSFIFSWFGLGCCILIDLSIVKIFLMVAGII